MKTYSIKLTQKEIDFICLSVGMMTGAELKDGYKPQSMKRILMVVNPILRKFKKAKGQS